MSAWSLHNRDNKNYITKSNLSNITCTNETCKNRIKLVTIPAYMRLVTRVTLTTAITHFERFKVCSSELTGKLLL